MSIAVYIMVRYDDAWMSLNMNIRHIPVGIGSLNVKRVPNTSTFDCTRADAEGGTIWPVEQRWSKSRNAAMKKIEVAINLNHTEYVI